MSDPYNPLDKLNLGRSVADALLARPVLPLSNRAGLVGAGVYALYYTGVVRPFEPYSPIAASNRDNQFGQPIYVGKAIPKGARKGGLSFDASKGTPLRGRLGIHARSINRANNLELDDFYFRALVIDDIWIPLGENMMIELFVPIWNRLIDGFGNNKPGVGRDKQKKSPWDTLHPGRPFAAKLPEGEVTQPMLIERLRGFFSGEAVPMVPVEDATEDDGDEEEEGVQQVLP